MKTSISKLTGLVFLLIFGSNYASAQAQAVPEYGTLSDIKEMHRVYVYSEDLESRNRILKELSKDSYLQVVGKLQDAEFFIFYGRSFFETGYSYFGGIFGSMAVGTVSRDVSEVGEYYVVMRGDKLENGFQTRILWGKQNLRRYTTKNLLLGGKMDLPETRVTKSFVKELRKVREGK